MTSVAVARRVSAVVAFVAVAAVIAIIVVVLFRHPIWLLRAIAYVGVAIGAAAYALTRTGARRVVARCAPAGPSR